MDNAIEICRASKFTASQKPKNATTHAVSKTRSVTLLKMPISK